MKKVLSLNLISTRLFESLRDFGLYAEMSLVGDFKRVGTDVDTLRLITLPDVTMINLIAGLGVSLDEEQETEIGLLENTLNKKIHFSNSDSFYGWELQIGTSWKSFLNARSFDTETAALIAEIFEVLYPNSDVGRNNTSITEKNYLEVINQIVNNPIAKRLPMGNKISCFYICSRKECLEQEEVGEGYSLCLTDKKEIPIILSEYSVAYRENEKQYSINLKVSFPKDEVYRIDEEVYILVFLYKKKLSYVLDLVLEFFPEYELSYLSETEFILKHGKEKIHLEVSLESVKENQK